MKLDSGFRFPCVTVKKIKIEVKSTSSPDQKVKAQNSFIHAGFQNHKGSNPTSEMPKISFSCGLDKQVLDEHLLFRRRLRREMFNLIPKQKTPSSICSKAAFCYICNRHIRVILCPPVK